MQWAQDNKFEYHWSDDKQNICTYWAATSASICIYTYALHMYNDDELAEVYCETDMTAREIIMSANALSVRLISR